MCLWFQTAQTIDMTKFLKADQKVSKRKKKHRENPVFLVRKSYNSHHIYYQLLKAIFSALTNNNASILCTNH